MGVVYYGEYAQYLEQGRTEWLRELGISYKYMEEHDVHLPVIDLHIQYKHPAKYDDLIIITTTLVNMPTKKIEFYYEIHNQEGKLLVTATTSLVFVDSKSKKIISAPNYFMDKLKEST
jgi:acyl-CoA thioester hydrolase